MTRERVYLLTCADQQIEGRHDRPQRVLDYIDFIWKAMYGEVLR